MAEERFDLMVVGGGTGRDIVLAASEQGLRVALVERGPLGGTCHNRGCMPSKMLIHSAELAEAVRDGRRFGINASIESVDLPSIVHNVFAELDTEVREREEDLFRDENIEFIRGEGRFVGPKSLEVDGRRISADRVVIAGGTRPAVPPIPGRDDVPYLTSDEALHLTDVPQRLAILGGGYVAVELGYFFGALGAEVTIIEMAGRLIPREDSEIGEWFTREFSRKHNVMCAWTVESLSQRDGLVHVAVKDNPEPVIADQLLIATGRHPNTDVLDVATTGVELDRAGYIKVNDYLETNVEGVWALGDITGLLPLKHVAVRQAKHLIEDLFHGKRRAMSYEAIPHAIFSSPQVAGVGKTEDELKIDGTPYRVGRWNLKATAMGMALKEDGLVKILTDESGLILGAHIVAPNASVLIHEIVVAMNAGGTLDTIVDAVHVHPALSQVVEMAAKAAQVAAPVRTAA